MKKLFALLALLGLPAAGSAASPSRVEAKQKASRMQTYPPEALKKGLEGNVVMTGTVTLAGAVAGLRILKSSSPLFDQAALKTVSAWKFQPATENGRPVAITLNAVVRFRKLNLTTHKPEGPERIPAPIVSNLTARPTGLDGHPDGPDGFPVIAGDHGISGVIDIDLPGSEAKGNHRVLVEDRLGSRKVLVLNKEFPGSSAGIEVTYFRQVDPASSKEQGAHELMVTVDGKGAGGGVYLVKGR